MLNVLINAYGCSPSKGSEGGLGWMWVSHLAKFCKIHVIAEAEGKEDVSSFLPSFEYKDNVQFHFIDIGERARKMCWNQGDWRFYYFYRLYQQNVYKLAKELHRKYHFDVVHHLNMICFREPGYLWKLDGCKFVWGPIGGFGALSSDYLKQMPKRIVFKNDLKNLIRTMIIYSSVRIRRAFDRADVLISATNNAYEGIKKYYHKDSILINETGLDVKLSNVNERDFNATRMKIVWVGRFIPTKFLDIALKSLACINRNIEYEFHILGDGDLRNYYKDLAINLGINDRCIWHGMISRDEVQNVLSKCHLFFFTSLVEGTSHAVLEAIANKLPILCFDTCGHGSIINERMGVKIPVCSPGESIKRFSDEIEHFYYDRNRLSSCATATFDDLEKHTWDYKAKQMYEIYKKITSMPDL